MLLWKAVRKSCRLQYGALAVNTSNFSSTLCERKTKCFCCAEFYRFNFIFTTYGVTKPRPVDKRLPGRFTTTQLSLDSHNWDTGVSLLLHFKHASPWRGIKENIKVRVWPHWWLRARVRDHFVWVDRAFAQMHQKENNLPVCPWVLNLVRHAGNINVVLSGDYFPPQKKK